ncbi:MAG: DUF1573 domain-containing protein [Bacteroidia bacterium]|nr:DUF1573 domain-containing protein [Bacteroidia bacterium]
MKIRLRYFTLLLIATAFFSCRNSFENKSPLIPDNALNPDLIKNPQSASGENKSDMKLPAFSFKTETHEFGTITEGEKVSYSFQFTNSGKADLVITNASGSCGCTVPEYSKEPVPPGKTGMINVIFDSSGKEGHQNKTVTIVANTIPNSKVITITGEVVKQKK